jgi:hypothetical protein
MFLEKLAKYILDETPDLRDRTFIFPNRRSGLFFRRFLAEQAGRTTWAPEILTISDFMEQLSGLKKADPLDLLFELYGHYRTMVSEPEPFDAFFPWAELMIRDFDALDKYLVDPESIFRNIKEIKEIDAKFGGLEEEQIAYIRKFWIHFNEGNPSDEKEVFLQTWNMLPTIYAKLSASLKAQGKGYEGLLYREVAGMPPDLLRDRLKRVQYIIVGLNALNACEKTVLKRMQQMDVVRFFWDYDRRYIDDQHMEAGRFMRENIREFPPAADLEEFSGLSATKEIRIFDLPSDILQAKTVHRILSDRDEPLNRVNDVAVVACDEDLLMPVLSSLPPDVGEVNVTMGYPFSNTPLNSFIDALLRLIRNARIARDGSLSFYHRDVVSVLHHQYFRLVAEEDPGDAVKVIHERNLMYVDAGLFNGAMERRIFSGVSDAASLCTYLREVLRYILSKLKEREDDRFVALEEEYILLMLTRLNKLSEHMGRGAPIEIQTFVRLLRKLTSGLRVPFIGEPLAGLQVMGILESRLLDFDHVIMLSMNEDTMPGASDTSSFIPYSLRFAYGLPVREDMDAIYAYYFYRLIQRADKVDLLFNSASEGVKSGEMSRYLYQMNYEYNAQLIRPLLPVHATEINPIVIEKTVHVQELLAQYLVGSEETRYLSPSALNAYIECPFKFYLKFLCGVDRADEVLEELDAIGLGNILHESIYRIYEPFRKKKTPVRREDIEALLNDPGLDVILREAFNEEYFHSRKMRPLEGRNLVFFDIIRSYLRQILRIDAGIAPFDILELEQKHRVELQLDTGKEGLLVQLGGTIDRVDRPPGAAQRIIDYKTGKADRSFTGIEALFDPERKNRNKEAFQALMYAWIYAQGIPDVPVRPGLYIARNLFAENYSPEFRMGEGRKKEALEDFTPLTRVFEEKLRDLLREIFDREIPFTQTDIEERCRGCDFKNICQRN